MAEIAHLACIASSTDWPNIPSDPKWSLWSLAFVSLDKCLLIQYHRISFRGWFGLAVHICHRVNTMWYTLHHILTWCMALTSVIFIEIRIQTYIHWINRSYKWLIDGLANQILVSMLSNKALTYLLHIIPASNRSWIGTKVTILSSTILEGLLDCSLILSQRLISVWTLVTFEREILAQSYFIKLLGCYWSLDRTHVWLWYHRSASAIVCRSSWSMITLRSINIFHILNRAACSSDFGL